MLSLLIAAPLLAPVQVGGASAVQVSVEISATSFAARNHSEHPQVLLFRNASQELVVARTLSAGADVLWSFPRQALEGVLIEVVSVTPSGLRNSGSLALDKAFDEGAEGVWVQHGFESPVTWLEIDGTFERHPPASSLLPRALLDASGLTLTNYGDTQHNPGIHVPEPTPSPRLEDYGPPELEVVPLPPV